MAVHLRDRRRIQTELDIQRTAVDLIGAHGYEHVTTSMIAEHCGMSVRTFFNYYENKDAAVIGPKNTLTPVLVESFLAGQGEIFDDLKFFVAAHLETIAEKRDMMRQIMTIAREAPRVHAAQSESGQFVRTALDEALKVRLGSDHADLSGFIADIGLSALGQAYRLWLERDDLEMMQAVDRVFGRLDGSLHLLTDRSGRFSQSMRRLD